MPTTSTVKIEKFLGVRLDDDGDTNLKVGELSRCDNIRITSNYKAKKREGYLQLFNAISANKRIQGMWYGLLGSTYHFLCACNGHIYKVNMSTYALTDLGTLADAPTSFFTFNSKLYIQNGTEYYAWTGTGSIAVVAGYRPVTYVATPPAGGGTLYEAINNLTGQKAQRFSGDGVAAEYVISETAVTSIDYVKVDGVTKILTTDYTVNVTTGKVTPVAPATFTLGVDNIEIGWTKGTGTRSEVITHKHSILFGGKNDSRVFLYGDGTNTMIYSALADGVPSAEYFPPNNYNTVGSDEYPITYLAKQYDRQIIFTSKNSYYSLYEFDTTLGANFPVYPLNDVIGNKALGQGQIIQNNPFTLDRGVYQFIETGVRDVKNAEYMSERIHTEFDSLDHSTAVTMNFRDKFEYWCAIGTSVYVYNYAKDVWYKFILQHTPTCFVEINGLLYFGTTSSQIMKFDDVLLTDNGTAISSIMETGFIDFGENWKRKFLNFAWIGLEPDTDSSAEISWQSDYSASVTDSPELIDYNLVDFENVDYGDETYDVNYNPQPFRMKLKCKKFTYLKIIISNDSATDRMTILGLTMPALIGGNSK